MMMVMDNKRRHNWCMKVVFVEKLTSAPIKKPYAIIVLERDGLLYHFYIRRRNGWFDQCQHLVGKVIEFETLDATYMTNIREVHYVQA